MLLTDMLFAGIACGALISAWKYDNIAHQKLDVMRAVVDQTNTRLSMANEKIANLSKLNAEQEVLIEHLDREADQMATMIDRWVPARDERGLFQKRSH